MSKMIPNEDFGYRAITVERPLRLASPTIGQRLRGTASDQPLTIWPSSEGRRATRSIDARAARERLKEGRSGRRASIWTRSQVSVVLPKPPAVARQGTSRVASFATLSLPEQRGLQGRAEPGSELRDTENVPLEVTSPEYLAARGPAARAGRLD